MRQSGINLENVKKRNRSAILKLLGNEGGMSRKDISSSLKLTPAAVTQLCAEMIESGIMLEKGALREEIRAGRKKILVDLNYEYKYVLSIDIGVRTTFLTISDLMGRLLKTQTIQTNINIEPEMFLTEIVSQSKMLIKNANIDMKNVLGIGVCIPGFVDRKKGVSEHAYGIWNKPVPIRSILQIQFNHSHPIIVENNVKAYAEAELVYGAGRKNDNMLFVKWGPGVGSAIVINGEIYGGKNNASAEIGHYIVDFNGKPCKCGRKGCLETIVSSDSIVEHVKEIFSKDKTSELFEKLHGDKNAITMSQIGLWSEIKDKEIVNIINDCIRLFASAVVNMITIIDPDIIVLYGFMLEEPYVEATFLDFCSRYAPFYEKDNFIKSVLSSKINYIGATAIVAKKYFFENGGAI